MTDTNNTLMTTMGMERVISLNVPLVNSNGANAATDVSTPTTTGANTFRAPPDAASIPLLPAARSASIFSPITIASSTTNPSTMIKPNSEIIVMVTPSAPNSRMPPIKAVAMPTLTQTASFRSSIKTRNRKTRAKPYKPFFSSRLIRSRSRSVSSSSSSISTPKGAL